LIDRQLQRIAGLSLRRPAIVLTAMLVPALLLSLYALRVPVDFSFSGLMDRTHPEVERYFAASERYGIGGLLPLLIEGPEERLDEASAAVDAALLDLDFVLSVVGPPAETWLQLQAPWLVEPEAFDAWLAFALDPEDSASEARLQRELDALQQAHDEQRAEGARLLLVTMAEDSFELALDADHFPRIRAAAREAAAPFAVTTAFAGMPAIVTQEQEATIERLRVLGPVSLLGVVLLLALLERRPSVLAGVVVPMLLSVGMTLAIVGLVAGRFTIMESVFGILVFGLGVDFAIHLIVRLREERSRGRSFEGALRRAVVGTGRGILTGAATTSGAFFIIALAPDPVFARLGLAGGLGLALCLIFLIVLLPAEWVLIDRWRPLAKSPRPPPTVPGLAALARAATRHSGWVVGAALLLLVLSAVSLPRFRYETNLERVFSREIQAVQTARDIKTLFGVDPAPWIVTTPDLEEARRLAAAFEADPLFDRTEHLALFLPADRDARQARLDAIADGAALALAEAEKALRSVDAAAAERGRERLLPLRALAHAHQLGPPQPESLPAGLTERLVGPDGELIVYAFAAHPAMDSAVAARERRAAQAIDPNATSISALFEALIGTDRPWMAPLVAAVLVFIVGILYLDLRSWRLTFLAGVPVMAGGFVTLGVLDWWGFAFNTVTLVGIPLLLGVGVDDGVHIVHRMLEEPERSIDEVVTSVGRGIAMTTLTTCASVAALLFTEHPGIESVAILLLIGLPLCLLASTTLLPACAVWLGYGSVFDEVRARQS
jgi:predicted RND superfamily exporter protein